MVERKWDVYKDLTGLWFTDPLSVLVCGMCVCVCVCVCVCHLFKMTNNQVQIESVNILIFYIGKFCRINVNMEMVVIRTNSILFIIYWSNYDAIKQDFKSKTIMTQNNKKYVKVW